MRKFVSMLIIFIITIFAVDSAFGEGEKDESNVYYNQVRVLKGDTYWDIAGRFDSGDMTREEYTKYIMEFNNAESDKIMAGQNIMVPVIADL